MSKKPLLVVIVGPTAVGKTGVSVDLAEKFKSEIISADSRQFYKEMEIGTAKPSNEELARVRHHFVNNLSIHEEYSVGQFEKEALAQLDVIFKQQKMAIMVGGSGLYVDAVCYGMDDFPDVDSKFRQALKNRLELEGIAALQKELMVLDPEYFEIVDKNNPQRIIRALEVILSTGQTFSSFRKREKKERSFRLLKIGLVLERENIYQRINDRMDAMIDRGLFEEAEKLYPMRTNNALQTVGYQEIFRFIDEEYNKEEAIRLLKRNSRRYAKRQLTWFRRDQETHWFSPEQMDQMIELVNKSI